MGMLVVDDLMRQRLGLRRGGCGGAAAGAAAAAAAPPPRPMGSSEGTTGAVGSGTGSGAAAAADRSSYALWQRARHPWWMVKAEAQAHVLHVACTSWCCWCSRCHGLAVHLAKMKGALRYVMRGSFIPPRRLLTPRPFHASPTRVSTAQPFPSASRPGVKLVGSTNQRFQPCAPCGLRLLSAPRRLVPTRQCGTWHSRQQCTATAP